MKYQSITRGIASNWAGLAVTVAISFFMSPFIVNKLGSIYYGIWALTQQFTGYLYLLDFGVRESVVRYTSKYVARKQPAQLNAVLTTAAVTYLPIILGCLLITLLCVWAVPGPFEIEESYLDETRWAVLLTGLTITQTFVFNPFFGIVQGLRRYDIANGINMFYALLRVPLTIYFLSNDYGLVALAVIQFSTAMATGLTTTVVAIVMLKRRGMAFRPSLPKGRRRRALFRRVFGYGAYALLHTFGQKIVFASDAIVVGLFLSVGAVTYYSIAGSLIQYFRSLLSSTSRVFLPATSELHARGKLDELRRLFLQGAKLTTLIALPLGVTFAVLGGEFIGLWMGPKFKEESGGVLLVLALTQIFSAPNNVVGSLLYGISKHRILAFLRMGEAVANVTLSIILVKWMGLIGVALGTAISHIILVLFVLPKFACPLIGVRVRDYLLAAYGKPFLSAVPFAAAQLAVLHYVEFHNFVQFFGTVALLCLLYVPLVWFVSLNDEERQLVRRKTGLKLAF
jgi:O-antigen/teichoic acid export membrane protein